MLRSSDTLGSRQRPWGSKRVSRLLCFQMLKLTCIEGVVVRMLWGFVWRHAYWPTPLSDGAGFFMEYMLGPRFLAEKLCRDHQLFKIVIPPTATNYLYLIRWKNRSKIRIHFNILNSPTEYELKVLEEERSEKPERQRAVARLLESEH